jgi:DNA-binding protein H-NS
MATRHTGQTLQSLQIQIAELEAQAEVVREKEKGKVIAQLRDAIRDYGLTAADLGLDGAGPKPRASTPPAGQARKGRKSATRRGTGAVKFSDGQGHTWSGVGKRPNWFKDALAAGKRPEDLMTPGAS